MTNKKGIFSASQGERKALLRSSKTKLKKYHKSWNKQTSVPIFPPGSLHASLCTEQPGSAMEYLGLEVKQEAQIAFPCAPGQVPHSWGCGRRPGARCWTAGGGLGAGGWRTWWRFLCRGWRSPGVLLQESGSPEGRKANPAINECAVISAFQRALTLPSKTPWNVIYTQTGTQRLRRQGRWVRVRIWTQLLTQNSDILPLLLCSFSTISFHCELGVGSTAGKVQLQQLWNQLVKQNWPQLKGK